jgi:hypothetical protein
MVGLGILLRVMKRLFGKTIEETGALPTRYYLREILDALDRDNLGEAVRLLRLSKGALVDRSRWELVRQQVLFRCRVLVQRHGSRIRSIEERIERLRRQRRLPWRLLRKGPGEKLVHYEKVLSLERCAQTLLQDFEKSLKNI